MSALGSTANDVMPFQRLQLAGCNTDCGRLEIAAPGTDGHWHYLCSNNWTLREAGVVCRSLGFESAFAAFPTFGGADADAGPLAVNISCDSGSEIDLSECSYSLVNGTSEGCSPGEAVGVACRASGAMKADLEFKTMATDAVAEWIAADARRISSAEENFGVNHNNRKLLNHEGCEIHPMVPRPWTSEFAREAFVFYELVEADYAIMDAELVSRLCDPTPIDDVERGQCATEESCPQKAATNGERLQQVLVDLVSRGLQWNALGMDLTSISPPSSVDSGDPAQVLQDELDLVMDLYLSYNPHASLHNNLDQPLRHSQNPMEVEEEDAMFQHLQRDGFLPIDNFGLGEETLQSLAQTAVTVFDPDFESNATVQVSSTSGGLVATARLELPAIDALFLPAEATADRGALGRVITKYLGPALLDGYKITKLATSSVDDEKSYVASRWHHDRSGRRLKAFIYLHDCDCDQGHPTQVALATHNMLFYRTDSLHATRFNDDYVNRHFTIAKGCGQRGGGFIFDTHSVHKGTPEGSHERTTVIMEFHNQLKCPAVRVLGLPLPCPSGDQYMRQVKLTDTAPFLRV